MKHWTVAGIRQLCCLALFGAPFAEAAMPGGDVYLACMAGIVAFAGIAAEAWCGRTAFVPGKTDFLFGACLVYAAARMPLPVGNVWALSAPAIHIPGSPASPIGYLKTAATGADSPAL